MHVAFIMQVLVNQLPFVANKNAEVAVVLASQLHKNRGTCCTAEWLYHLYPILTE